MSVQTIPQETVVATSTGLLTDPTTVEIEGGWFEFNVVVDVLAVVTLQTGTGEVESSTRHTEIVRP